MNLDLTPEQIASYREQGFLRIERLLDADELTEWREAVGEAMAVRAETRVPHLVENAGTFDALPQQLRDYRKHYDDVFTQRLYLWKTSQRMRRLVLNEGLGELAAKLEGVAGVRIWQDQVLVKEPWGKPTVWHLDGPLFPFTTPHCLSIWVALDDATLTNGCLAYIPGSHLARSMKNGPVDKELGGLFKENPEWADLEPVFCPVPAGGAVLHNGYIAHGAGANMTPGRRRAMTIVYIEDGATFDAEDPHGWPGAWAWSEAERSRYRRGDRLDHPDQFPLAFRRSPHAPTGDQAGLHP